MTYSYLNFEPDILEKKFDNCFKMSFLDKEISIQTIQEKLIEGCVLLVISHQDTFIMGDIADFYPDEIQDEDDTNKPIFGMFRLDIKEIIIYAFF